MLGYALRRLLVAIPTLLLLVIACFFLMHAAPGGPFTSERPLPPEVLANIEARYGLDQPLWKQLWDYVSNIVLRFDFGPSVVFKDRDVNDIIAQGFPISLYLGPEFVYVLTGSVFVDIYFSTGGLGKSYVSSALTRDYAVLLGVTILYGALTVVVNLLTDLAYAWFDPKIRFQ